MVTAIREVRANDQLKNQDKIKVFANSEQPEFFSKYNGLLKKLCGIEQIELVSDKVEDTQSVNLKNHQLYIDTGKEIDVEAEIEKITEELNYTKGFLKSVEKKLSNERFVNNAPEAVVNKEKQKQADAEATIVKLENRLAELEQ